MAVRQDTTLGELDFQAVQMEVNDASSTKRGLYIKFYDVDSFNIGKYSNENGPAATVRKFSQKFTTLNESTVRTFRKKYREQVKKAEMESRAVSQAIGKKREAINAGGCSR